MYSVPLPVPTYPQSLIQGTHKVCACGITVTSCLTSNVLGNQEVAYSSCYIFKNELELSLAESTSVGERTL